MRWKKNGYKRRKKRRWLPLLLLLFLELGALLYLLAELEFSTAFQDIYSVFHTADEPVDWNLILINKNHPIPKDYSVELTTLSNGERVDSRIYPDLQAMFDDARAAGLGLFVAAGYRTQEKQQQLYGFIQRYPPDKTVITGIINEPWHYRYVGKDAAKEISERGVCLEEYLDAVDWP